jgi:hypothetical protein
MRQVHDIKGFVVFAGRVAAVGVLLVGCAPAAAAGDLNEARQLYNLGRYEAAIAAAAAVVDDAAAHHAALVVLARAGLERFRQTADPADLVRARDALREVDASRLEPRDRLELLVGLGEALYLDDLFLPAADLLEDAVADAQQVGPSARDQLLDWWATALDRQAQVRQEPERIAIYDRILARMDAELAEDPGTSAAAYWMAVAARGKGDSDLAWDLARTGWVRGQLTRDRGAALRPDLDRLVRDAIIPERAQRIQSAGGDLEQATAGMIAEWESFTGKWNK